MKIQVQDRSKLASLHHLASEDWGLDNLPKTLTVRDNWSPCYLIGDIDPDGKIVKTPKRPIAGPTASGRPYKEVIPKLDLTKHQHFGLLFKEHDELIAIDVDELPEQFDEHDLPIDIRRLIKDHPTFIEISASGTGIHIYYLASGVRQVGSEAQSKITMKQGIAGEIFVKNCFMVTTGHTLPKSLEEVSSIRWTHLEDRLMGPAKVKAIKDGSPVRGLATSAHDRPCSMNKFEELLYRIPPSISGSDHEAALRRCYSGFSSDLSQISDYDHWRTILAALHDAGRVNHAITRAEELGVNWSATDPANYEGADSVSAKFHDNPPIVDGITWKSLVALAHSIEPSWTGWKPGSKEKGIPPTPDPAYIENWTIAAKHYEVQIRQNVITKQVTFGGGQVMVDKYFNSGQGIETETGMVARMLHFGQNVGLPKATKSHAEGGLVLLTERDLVEYDPFQEWIESGPEFDPERGSYVQAVFECLIIPEKYIERTELYREYFVKNMMGVIRGSYYEGQFGGTQGMLILQGAESTYKSTFLNMLMPLDNGAYVVNSQLPAKVGSIKEHQIENASALLVIRDEVASFTKSGDDAVKNLLVQTHDSYRPVFGKQMVRTKRRCIFAATTNEKKFGVTDRGSRRFQTIPIERCDTDALAKIDMRMFYKELKHIYDNTPDHRKHELWVLGKETIKVTNDINSNELRDDQNSDRIFKYLFDTEVPWSWDLVESGTRNGTLNWKGHLMTKSEMGFLMQEKSRGISVIAAEHGVRRVLGIWTGTNLNPLVRETRKGTITIEEGYMTYRLKKTGKVSKSGWVVPPRILTTDFEPDPEEVEANNKLD